MAIQIPVVLYKMFLAVLLGDEENWSCLGRYRWSDLATAQIFLEELVEFLSFLWRQGIDTPFLWLETFHEFYFMVKATTMLWKWYVSF